jgi:hypothetical protein
VLNRSALPVLLLTTLLLAGPSFADDEAGPQPTTSEQADGLIREGVALRKEGREAEALELFRRGYALEPTPRARGQMGLAAKSLRRYVEAEEWLVEALAAGDDAWVEESREALELALAIVQKQLASLVVLSNVEGAKLSVNGALVGTLPLERPVRLHAGAARLVASAPKYVSRSLEATLPAGELTELRLDLVKAPLPVPQTKPRRIPLPLPETTPPEQSVWRLWLYGTGGAVAAVGIGLGTYFGVRTIMARDERDEVCPDPVCSSDEGVDLDAEARTAATLSTISFVAGASGIAAALVTWATAPGDAASALVVLPANTGAMLGLHAQF